MNIPAQIRKRPLLFSVLALALCAACAPEPPINQQQMMDANTQADLTSLKSTTQEMRQRLESLEARLGPQGQGGIEDINARLSRLEATVARMATTLGVDTSGPATDATGQTPSAAPSAPQGPATDSGSEQPQSAAAPAQQPAPNPSAMAAPADQAQNIYRMAEDAFNQRDMARAQGLLAQLVQSFPDSPLVPDALYWQAQAAAQQGDYAKAALACQSLIQKYPNHPRVPSAMLTQSLAFRKLGKDQAALTVLQEVVKRFPNTPEARSAQAQLHPAR